MSAPDKICTRCGTVSKGSYRGSILVTLLLLVPLTGVAILYEVIRLMMGRVKCPKCKALTLIPADSPTAQKATESPPPATGTNVVPFTGGQ